MNREHCIQAIETLSVAYFIIIYKTLASDVAFPQLYSPWGYIQIQ